MRLTYLRWIDKYIGIPLCSFFIIQERIFGLLSYFSHRRLHEKPIEKIIIIKFWGFGSILLASGAFQALRYNFPKAQLCVFTLTQNKPIYEMLGFFDEIIDVDLKSVPLFLFQVLKSLRKIRKSGFDLTIDFEFTSRFSAIVTYLSNTPRRVGFKYQDVWRGKCYTDEVEFREDRKLSSSFLNLTKKITKQFMIPTSLPSLRLGLKDREYADILLAQEHITLNRFFVGMNVNASELSLLRRWPKEYFIVLTKELIRRYSAHIIFIGDKNDYEYVSKIIEELPLKENIHNFTGKTSLPQLAYLLGKMNLFISNDSGPLHLAAFIGVPTVSFFGPETPLIYGPEGKKHIIFYKKLDCSPCIRIKNYKYFHCINNHCCLREIKPEEVISEIERAGYFKTI